MMKPPPTPSRTVSIPVTKPSMQRRQRRDVEARAIEAPAERQHRDQRIVAPGGARLRACFDGFKMSSAVAASLRHQHADAAQHEHVEDRDDGIDLARSLEQAEQEAAEDRADHAAGDDHRAHLHVDAAAAAMGEHARDRRAGDLGGRRGDRDRRRDAVEDQDRRGEEAAADADHAGQQADQPAEADDHQSVHRQARDRQIDVHWPATLTAKARARKARGAKAGGAHHGRTREVAISPAMWESAAGHEVVSNRSGGADARLARRPARRARADSLDSIARDYVRLVLEIGERDSGYVDAYYGPPAVAAGGPRPSAHARSARRRRRGAPAKGRADRRARAEPRRRGARRSSPPSSTPPACACACCAAAP